VDYYSLRVGQIVRKLPLIFITPKVKVASLNLLGDRILVEELAKDISKILKGVKFDYFVGPEVKVVPLLHELSNIFNKERYIVCRKNIHGYMSKPIKSKFQPQLIIDGTDAEILKDKKVVILDDVITSGKTLSVVEDLIKTCGASVSAKIAVFKQEGPFLIQKDICYLFTLPVFLP